MEYRRAFARFLHVAGWKTKSWGRTALASSGPQGSGRVKQGSDSRYTPGRTHTRACDLTIEPDGLVMIKMGTRGRYARHHYSADDTRYVRRLEHEHRRRLVENTKHSSRCQRCAICQNCAGVRNQSRSTRSRERGQVRQRVVQGAELETGLLEISGVPINTHGKNPGGRDRMMNNGIGGL
jgi:hypothetical protein